MKKLLISIIIILAITNIFSLVEIKELKARAEFIAWHSDDYVEGE